MVDEMEHPLWSYHAVFKQTAGGGGTVQAIVTATTRTVILFGQTGPDNYAAGKQIYVRHYDEDDEKLATLMNQTGQDNTELVFPWSDHSVQADKDGPQLNMRVVMGKGDYLLIAALSLVQNEELTVAIRALLDGMSPPLVTSTGSGGTVTITVDTNAVI